MILIPAKVWPVHFQAASVWPLTCCGLGHHDRLSMEVVTDVAKVTCGNCRATADYRESVRDRAIAESRLAVRVEGRRNSGVPDPWVPIQHQDPQGIRWSS